MDGTGTKKVDTVLGARAAGAATGTGSGAVGVLQCGRPALLVSGVLRPTGKACAFAAEAHGRDAQEKSFVNNWNAPSSSFQGLKWDMYCK